MKERISQPGFSQPKFGESVNEQIKKPGLLFLSSTQRLGRLKGILKRKNKMIKVKIKFYAYWDKLEQLCVQETQNNYT